MRWRLAHIEVLALSLLLVAACENTVDSPDWPAHDEKLVVTGFLRLQHDSLFAYARVNRTLPLGEKFELQKAWVNDAELQVTNGSRAFTIPWARGTDPFFPFDFDFNYCTVTTPGSEDKFTLTLKQGGKTASAFLQVKSTATRFTEIKVEKSPHNINEYRITYQIPAPDPELSVNGFVEVWNSDFNKWWVAASFHVFSLANLSGGILEDVFYLWSSDWTEDKPRIRYTLTAHSRVYQNYANARWDYGGGDSPFDPPQKNPRFNVTGDGIGFFWYEIVGDPVEIQY